MRILAIDFGVHEVRFADLELSSKTRRIMNLQTLEIDGQTAQDLLKNYLSQSEVHFERIVCGLGGAPVFIKTMEFPFSDQIRVHLAVENAFADELPFEPEGFIIEAARLKKVGKSYQYLAGICGPEVVQIRNDWFQNAGLIPNAFFVDVEALGQLALNQNLPNRPESDPYAVVDFGSRSLKVAILKGGRREWLQLNGNSETGEILDLRTISRGTDDAMEYLADSQKLSAQDLRSWIETRAEIKDQEVQGEPQPSDNVSDEIKNSLRPLMVEVYQCFQAFRGRTGQLPTRVFYTGSLTHIRGFREFVERELRCPSTLWPLAIGFESHDMPAHQERSFAVALALGHYYSIKKPAGWLNFRRGAQSQRRVITQVIEWIRHPDHRGMVLSFCIAFSFLWIYTFSFNMMATARLTRLKTDLAGEFRRLNPDKAGPARTFAQDTEKAKNFLEAERKNKAQKNKVPENLGAKSKSYSQVFFDLSNLKLPSGAKFQNMDLSPQGLSAKLKLADATADTNKISQDFRQALEGKGYNKVVVKVTDPTLISIEAGVNP